MSFHHLCFPGAGCLQVAEDRRCLVDFELKVAADGIRLAGGLWTLRSRHRLGASPQERGPRT